MDLQLWRFPDNRYLEIVTKRLKDEFLETVIYELTDGFKHDYNNHVYDDVLDDIKTNSGLIPSEKQLIKASKYYYCTDKSVNPRNLDFNHAAALYSSNKSWFKDQNMLKTVDKKIYYANMDVDMWDFQAESNIFSEMSDYVTHLEYTNYMSEIYFSIKTEFFFKYNNGTFTDINPSNLSNVFQKALDKLVHFDQYKKHFKIHADWIKNNKYSSLKSNTLKDDYYNIDDVRNSGVYIPEELTVRIASFWSDSQVSDCIYPIKTASTIEGWNFNYQDDKYNVINRYPGDIEIII